MKTAIHGPKTEFVFCKQYKSATRTRAYNMRQTQKMVELSRLYELINFKVSDLILKLRNSPTNDGTTTIDEISIDTCEQYLIELSRFDFIFHYNFMVPFIKPL